jgi:hypothetical protein
MNLIFFLKLRKCRIDGASLYILVLTPSNETEFVSEGRDFTNCACCRFGSKTFSDAILSIRYL